MQPRWDEAIVFWNGFEGRWLRYNEFIYPNRAVTVCAMSQAGNGAKRQADRNLAVQLQRLCA